MLCFWQPYTKDGENKWYFENISQQNTINVVQYQGRTQQSATQNQPNTSKHSPIVIKSCIVWKQAWWLAPTHNQWWNYKWSSQWIHTYKLFYRSIYLMEIKTPLDGRLEHPNFIMLSLMPTKTHLPKLCEIEYQACIQLFMSSPRITNDNDTWFSRRYAGPSIW